MSHADYEWDQSLSLIWFILLSREDSQGTWASISWRFDFLEKGIRERVLSSKEIIQMCNDFLKSIISYKILVDLKTTMQITLILLTYASINTDYLSWLKDESLHYRLRLLNVLERSLELRNDALQLWHAIYSFTIITLRSVIAFAWFRDAEFMRKSLESLTHCELIRKMSKVSDLCKDFDFVIMRKLFYIVMIYMISSNHNFVNTSDRCENIKCSHIDCQLYYTSLNWLQRMSMSKSVWKFCFFIHCLLQLLFFERHDSRQTECLAKCLAQSCIIDNEKS